MRIDLYTKIVLTVIAVSLAVIATKQITVVPSVTASTSNSPAGQVQANYDGSINVRVIDIKTPSDGLPVNVKRFPSSSTVPVEVKNRSLNVEVANRSLNVEVGRTVDVNVKNNYIQTRQY